MRRTFRERMSWADQFIPHMKGIWKEVLAEHDVIRITEAPPRSDYYEETDMFAITKSYRLRLANRVRSHSHYLFHENDFTIRNSGRVTELQRIVDLEYGDYYLYAFANEWETDLIAWVVLDLDIFRREYKHAVKVTALKFDMRKIEWTEECPEKGNPFLAFKLETFVPEVVVASHNHNRLPKGDSK